MYNIVISLLIGIAANAIYDCVCKWLDNNSGKK